MSEYQMSDSRLVVFGVDEQLGKKKLLALK